MAKTTTTRAKGKDSKKARSGASARAKPPKKTQAPAVAKDEGETNGNTAADAIVGLLESPLVADMLAAGAAAALAAFTQHRLTRRRENSSKRALKEAAKAAAAAMGARLSEEFEEILESAKRAKAEAS